MEPPPGFQPKFSLGDRVRVSRTFFVEDLQGAVGLVARPPEEVTTHGPSWNDFWRLEPPAPRWTDFWRPWRHSRPPCVVYWIEFGEIDVNDPEDHAGTAADMGEEDLERLDGSAEKFPCGVPKPFDG